VFTVENVVGGSGNDTLKGSVPHNTFNCGPGRDTVSADSTDTLVNCDRGGTGSVSPLKPKAKAKGKKVTIDTGATAACPATAPSACSVTATATAKLGKKSASFGTVKATPAAGSSLRVVLKVPKKTLKAWRKAGKVKITFTITITVPDGTPATVTKTAKLKAPKAK
jgi:Ca2+-binding RTX toxin-like protein